MFSVLALLGSLALVLFGCNVETGMRKEVRDLNLSPPEGTTETNGFASGTERPPSTNTMFALAQLLATQGQDRRAQLTLKRVIQLEPRYAPAYSELAELHMRHQRVKDAIATLEEGLSHCPDDPVLTNNLGMCYLTQGNHKKALKYFTRASGIKPHNARYRGNMAVVLGLMGRYEESLSLFQQVVSPLDAHRNLKILSEARNDEDQLAQELLEIYRLRQNEQSE